MDLGSVARHSSKKEENHDRYIFEERKRSLRDEGTYLFFFLPASTHG